MANLGIYVYVYINHVYTSYAGDCWVNITIIFCMYIYIYIIINAVVLISIINDSYAVKIHVKTSEHYLKYP